MNKWVWVFIVLSIAFGAAWFFRLDPLEEMGGLYYRHRWTGEMWTFYGGKLCSMPRQRRQEEESKKIPTNQVKSFELSTGEVVEVPEIERKEFFEEIKEKGITAKEL